MNRYQVEISGRKIEYEPTELELLFQEITSLYNLPLIENRRTQEDTDIFVYKGSSGIATKTPFQISYQRFVSQYRKSFLEEEGGIDKKTLDESSKDHETLFSYFCGKYEEYLRLSLCYPLKEFDEKNPPEEASEGLEIKRDIMNAAELYSLQYAMNNVWKNKERYSRLLSLDYPKEVFGVPLRIQKVDQATGNEFILTRYFKDAKKMKLSAGLDPSGELESLFSSVLIGSIQSNMDYIKPPGNEMECYGKMFPVFIRMLRFSMYLKNLNPRCLLSFADRYLHNNFGKERFEI